MTRGYHRDAFIVEEPSGGRFDVAVERFLSGRAFEFREVGFSLGADGVVCCAVDSSWLLENVSLTTAETDLDKGCAALEYLVRQSPSFAAAVQGKPIRYELIENYGNGRVLLCSKSENMIAWATGLPRGI